MAERVQLVETRHEAQILRRVLGKSETRIDHDAVGPDPGGRGDLQPARKEVELVLDDVGQFLPVAACMHDDQPGAACRRDLRNGRIAMQAPDIIHRMGARRYG